MITRISIQNFKGIGDRITVPIRPITLLFGPNSAGKSSIMHAIHYLRDVEKNVDLPPHSVGVGISQVVPVITAVVAGGAQVVQIEQPELHLHPTQQAAIGDLLIAGIRASQRKQLLIETHSEHLILRILRRIRQTQKNQNPPDMEVRPEDTAVLYVEPRDGQTTVFEIGVGSDGELLQPWPDKFFDQDYEERFG